jgi:hypothetical protein
VLQKFFFEQDLITNPCYAFTLFTLAHPFFDKKVKDLTASDLLVSSDLSDSSSASDYVTKEPEHVRDQPTVAAAAGNLISPNAWTPIATGPRQPVPPEHRVERTPIPKKVPRRRSARIRVTKPKATIPKAKEKKEKIRQEPKGPAPLFAFSPSAE